MNAKSTAILLGLLVLLCAGYWVMLRSEETVEQRVEEAKRVFDFEPDDLVALSVERLGEAPSAGRRDDDGDWSVTAPHDTIVANQLVWNRVAEAFAHLADERTLEDALLDLPAYGLDGPALTVSGVTKRGDAVKVAFGLTEPTQLCRYAHLLEGGEPRVFLVEVAAFHELNRSLLDLRDRYLFALGEQGVTRLEFALFWQGDDDPDRDLAAGDESVAIVVERSDEGVWRVIEPFDAPADQEQVGALVKEVQFSVGRDYIDAPEDLSDYGLDPPRARITVVSGKADPQTLLFGALDSAGKRAGLFVKRAARPAVFSMDNHVISLFPDAVDAFREGRLLTRPASELRRVHYRTAETEVVLETDEDSGWRLTEPDAHEGDPVALSNFIAAIKGLRASGFPEEDPGGDQDAMGFDEPTILLALTFAGEDEPLEIRVGTVTAEGDAYYAMQDTGAVVTLPARAVEGLLWSPFDFRSRKLMRFDRPAAIRVALRFDAVNYRFDKVHGTWLVREPPGRRWESQSDMAALLEAINPVYAVSVEEEHAPKDLAPYGLGDALCTVSVVTAEGDPARAWDAEETAHGPLHIGATTTDDSQQRFAIVAGQPAVFRVKQDIIDGIREALRGVREP